MKTCKSCGGLNPSKEEFLYLYKMCHPPFLYHSCSAKNCILFRTYEKRTCEKALIRVLSSIAVENMPNKNRYFVLFRIPSQSLDLFFQ